MLKPLLKDSETMQALSVFITDFISGQLPTNLSKEKCDLKGKKWQSFLARYAHHFFFSHLALVRIKHFGPHKAFGPHRAPPPLMERTSPAKAEAKAEETEEEDEEVEVEEEQVEEEEGIKIEEEEELEEEVEEAEGEEKEE